MVCDAECGGGDVESWLYKGGEVVGAGRKGDALWRGREVQRSVVWVLVLSACGRGCVCVWVLWIARQWHRS